MPEIDLSLVAISALFIVYFIAGFIDAIAGGGGAISIPSLLLAGLPPQMTLGTNKFISLFGTTSSLLSFIKAKKLDFKLAFIGIIFSLIGSFLGSKLVIFIDEHIAMKFLIFLLPLGIILSLIKAPKSYKSTTSLSLKDRFIKLPIICILIGFYDGFYGPGTGSFLIICFGLFLKIDLVSSNALAKSINLASNISAFIVFALASKVLYILALPLIVANILGNLIGSRIAINKGSKLIKVAITLILILLFISLLIRYKDLVF